MTTDTTVKKLTTMMARMATTPLELSESWRFEGDPEVFGDGGVLVSNDPVGQAKISVLVRQPEHFRSKSSSAKQTSAQAERSSQSACYIVLSYKPTSSLQPPLQQSPL